MIFAQRARAKVARVFYFPSKSLAVLFLSAVFLSSFPKVTSASGRKKPGALPPPVPSFGLRTHLGLATAPGLHVGQPYSLAKLVDRSYDVMNTGNRSVQVVTSIEKPMPREITSGLKAIPDVRWVSIKNSQAEIGPEQEEYVDMTITVPNLKRFRGKKYLAIIHSRTDGADVIHVGLRSRLIIETAK